ncbi:peptidylprolyl isomerase [Streptomyces heliomycini]
MRNSVIASVLGVVLVGGGALYTTGAFERDDDKTNANAEVTPSARTDRQGSGPVRQAPRARSSRRPGRRSRRSPSDKSAKYTLKLDTTCGGIDVALKASAAPHTGQLVRLPGEEGLLRPQQVPPAHHERHLRAAVRRPDGHRHGGPGYTIPDENLKDESLKDNIYPAGTVAMANTGQKDSGGSQFFLVYQDSQLPPSNTPFGTVSDAGMKVLKKIADAGESTERVTGRPTRRS